MLRKVGVEEEFLALQAAGAALADAGDAVAAAAEPPDGVGQFEHELKRAQVELGSAPHVEVAEIRDELGRLRAELARAAAAEGLRVVASGTSPLDTRTATTREPRYEAMIAEYGRVAAQQVACGMHVHVDVADDEAGRVLDGLAPWLPVLTALAANSPFHDGADTGYASYRSVLWGMWPSAVAPGAIGDLAGYRRLAADLVTLGAARDAGMLYFAARLAQDYPTVEIRVCDVCPSPERAALLAALCRALVTWAADSGAADERREALRPEVLRAAAWRAARFGTGDTLADLSGARPRLRPAWDVVDDLVERLTPALGAAGAAGSVAVGLQAIRDGGTGADRQRSVAARDGLAAVLDDLQL